MKTQRSIPVKPTLPGQQGAARSIRYPAFLLTMLITLLLPIVAFAQDKSGVTPQVISLPSGPGSLEGLGESFEPNLSTGTSSYPVKFIAAPGRVGFQPEVSLHYDGGNANGPWGMGWKLSVPSIQRRTDDGLPTYREAVCGNAEPCHDDGEDQFIYSSGEKLVALSDGSYRFENESSFMRFRRLAAGSDGSGWEAHTPDGIRYVFGETGQARVTHEQGVFRWELERMVDTYGNELHFHYLHDGGYAYLKEIRYNVGQSPTGGEVYNAVVFNYEPRPDTYTDRRSGAAIRMGLRGADIQMWALGQLVRAYQFTYEPERSTGNYSLLIKVEQVGNDGASKLPPHTFTYTQFDASAHRVVTMQDAPPVALTNPDADLVDINADGLPDIVYTPASGGHRFYLNRGAGRWQAEPVIPANSPAERISNPNVRMADMNGDGRVDLLVKAGATSGAPFYYYASTPEGEWTSESRVDFGPSPAFDLNDPDVQLLDVNNDHRIDVVLTTGGRMKIWLARDGAWSQTADFDVAAPGVGGSDRFSDPNIRVGDITGDRMQDLIYVREGQVVYWPHNGNGSYDEGEVAFNPPTGVGQQAAQILLGDLNNDGLVDLVLPGNRVVYYWLSLGDGSFTDPIILTDTPPYDGQTTAVRLADIDGDGATELVYSSEAGIQYVDFSTGPQPFLLASVDNGLGRTIFIDYKSSIEDYLADWDAGRPWQVNLPFPVQVVRQVTVRDANSGEHYTIDYHYRDGYYDGVQKEFRGFVRSEEIKRGDETAATTVTRLVYDVGMTDESRKGMLLEAEVLAEGGQCSGDFTGCYQRTVNLLTTRVVAPAEQTTTRQPIAYAYISQVDSYVHEEQATPGRLRQTFEQDDYGNVTKEFNYGMVCGSEGNLDVTCGNDELLKTIEYSYNPERYIFNRPMRITQTDASGNFVSEVRMYYDGEPFVGLPLGQLTRGALTRQEASLGAGARFVATTRRAYNQYGNVIGMKDGNGNLTTVEYDLLTNTFPVVERLHFGDGKGALSYAASYDHGLGQVTTATDYNGHTHTFVYDTFGRIAGIVRPGDTLDKPTQEFSYQIGSPRSSITSKQRERSGSDNVITTVTYYDGLGRKLQVRSEAEGGRVIVAGAVRFNARQGVRDEFQPYFADSFAYAPPDPSMPHTVSHYDAMGRVVRTVNPDGSYAEVRHQPLAQLHFDEEDTRPDSPHAGTPLIFTYDGRQRLISTQETNRANGEASATPDRYLTRYVYDPLGNITQIVDAQGNVKTMTYDALSRKLRMVDPDRGETLYEYDDNDNLIRIRDAKGQAVELAYDAANRPLVERWKYGDGRADVVAAVYHYDGDLSPLHPDAANTMGQLAYVEDQAGTVHFSYDARGNVVGNIRRFAAEGYTFVTRTAYDAADRLVEVTYPDGSTVGYEYNERGLLARITGFVDQIDYVATGQRQTITYANGVATRYTYDARQRLMHLQTFRAQTILQELGYSFDGANNVVAIADGRAQRSALNDQSQQFTYDSLYRLTRAAGAYGQIDYGYDRIGNLVQKQSTAPDPALDLGELRYGENGAGPHALTFAGGLRYDYDANGNLVRKGDTVYTWNARNHLVAVEDSALKASFVYDADGERVKQTVREGDVVTTTLYAGPNVEVRGDELLFFVFDNTQRVAQISQPFAPERLLTGFADPPRYATPPTVQARRWYVSDHLGSASLLLDEAGQLVTEMAYYPFGLTRYETGADRTPYQFTDKELDATGLYYHGARYYDPLVGRFISVDPLYAEQPGRGVETPQALNLYAYALNNPLRYIDPDGYESDDTTQAQTEQKSWDYDPNGHLNDPRLNQEFVAAARRGLESAVKAGLRPRVHEAHREPEESAKRAEANKNGTGTKAADAWYSLHNYGLAMDVYLYDEKGTFINEKSGHKGWYGEYKKLSKELGKESFTWGGPHNDSVHFEYHPNWPDFGGPKKPVAKSMKTLRNEAIKASERSGVDWMQHLWHRAGAGGVAPPPEPEKPKKSK